MGPKMEPCDTPHIATVSADLVLLLMKLQTNKLRTRKGL